MWLNCLLLSGKMSRLLRARNYLTGFNLEHCIGKRFLNCTGDNPNTGLVLGLFNDENDPTNSTMTFTQTTKNINNMTNGKLSELIKLSGPTPRRGETRVFFGLMREFPSIVVVGMGHECVGYNEVEQIDELKEAIRLAAATGCRYLQELHVSRIFVESFGHAETAAEGAALGVWMYQELKNKKNQRVIPKLELHDDCSFTAWQIGLQKAAAQNLARQLCETPANLLTPIAFAQNTVDFLCKAGVNVEVKVRNWAKMMEMEGFIAASKGSCEPPVFMEISYYGCNPDIDPVVVVGKGVTFDSGGLCLKSKSELKHMRGDMAGAAAVVAACRAISALQLPINLRGLIPLSENLPGACAMKPGDVVKAKNGKTIIVENTDYDGRLCLADALSYSEIFHPNFVLDIGTLCKDLDDILGSAACAVFSNNESLYEQMRIASIHTGDRIWRFPLWKHFTEKVTSFSAADVGEQYMTPGSPCSAAAFLQQFAPAKPWVHMDTYGINRSGGDSWSYLKRGMSGRPTRTIIEFLAQMACQYGPSKEETKSLC